MNKMLNKIKTICMTNVLTVFSNKEKEQLKSKRLKEKLCFALTQQHD